MSEKIETLLIQNLSPHCRLIYLFGSYPKGNLTSESDIDIGVLFKNEKISFSESQNLFEPLRSASTRELDLITLNSADPIIRYEIIHTGKCIYKESEQTRIEFESRCRSEYVDFRESRKIIEDSLLTKGWPQWRKLPPT